MMQKTTLKPIAMVKATVTGGKLKIHRGKYDLTQFREGLKAELADKTSKAITSCASNDPNLLDKVVQAHLNEGSDRSIQWLQADKADKHEHGSKRALTQAEATASLK
jgi:hypothetical protein